mgnify:CR=1 FL=1
MDTRKFNQKKEWRKFGFGLTIIICLFILVHFFFQRNWSLPLLLIDLFILLFTIFFPVVLKPLFILFSYVGLAIGWVMTRMIITLLFFLVVTPISLMAKLVGKNFLDTRFKTGKPSYWKDVSSSRMNNSNYEKQF